MGGMFWMLNAHSEGVLYGYGVCMYVYKENIAVVGIIFWSRWISLKWGLEQ